MKKRLLIIIFALCLLTGAVVSSAAGLIVHAAETDENMGCYILSNEPADDELQDLSVKTISPFNGLEYTHAASMGDRKVVNGVCVSEWLTGIDWEKAKAAGVEFAFIRCGYTALSDKFMMLEDKNFEDNILNAFQAGIKVGVYYSSNAVTTNEVEQEASKTLEMLKNYRSIITLPIVCNYEMLSGSGRTAEMTNQQRTENVLTFMQSVKNAGYTAMYNGTSSFLRDFYNTALLAGYDCWLIDQASAASYTGDYAYWQYASAKEVDGFSGSVDCIFYYEPLADSSAQKEEAKPKTQKITYKTSNLKGGKVQYGAEFSLGAKASGKGKLSYKSSNSKVLSVDSKGNVSAKAYGSASITIKAAASKGYKKASRTVKLKVVPKTVVMTKGELRERGPYFEWKAVPAVDGYQCSYSWDKDFKEPVLFTRQDTHMLLTSYPNKRTLYLRIRAYKKIAAKTYYGDWCTAWKLRLTKD